MREIPLFGGKVALVDDDDYWPLMAHKWHEAGKPTEGQIYAMCNEWPYYMHFFVLGGRRKGYIVDHIDGNSLNNQRDNLRWTTMGRNTQKGKLRVNNRSGYRGVQYKKSLITKPWVARIKYDYNEYHLGCFATAEEAAEAYDLAALKFFGDYAQLNFSDKLTSYQEQL